MEWALVGLFVVQLATLALTIALRRQLDQIARGLALLVDQLK